MADYEARATLDTQQMIAALRAVDAAVERTRKEAESDFKKVEKTGVETFKKVGVAAKKSGEGAAKSAELSGFKIGAVSGIVHSLTNEFINLGKQAISTLLDIGKQSTQTALEFDTLRAQLLAIFGGSKEAANEAFNFIQQKSKELGIDLTELSAIFLPKVESLEQFERLAKLATAIARTSPQGEQAAIIGLTEALTGQFTSLQRRANIAKSDVDTIKKAFEEGGVEGFLEELDAVLQRTGRSFEATADTAQAAMNKVGEAGKQLGGILGEPIVEALQRQFDDLGAILNEREGDFTEIANAVGEVAASIIDFIGTNLGDFLANLDTEQVLEVVDGFQSMFDTAGDLVETLDLLEWPESFLDGLDRTVEGLDKALRKAFDLAAELKKQRARENAETEVRLKFAEEEERKAAEAANAATGGRKFGAFGQQANVAARSGDLTYGRAQLYGGLLGGIGAADIDEQARLAGDKAAAEAEQEIEEIRQQTEADQAARETARAKRAVRRKGDDSGAADAILAEMEAARQAAAALEAYEEAKNKVTEATVKLETELEQEASDNLLAVERKRLDALADFAEKRAQAARKNLQKIEDIERDHGRDLEDSDRKQARERIEADKEEAQERVDIEENFQRELADIRSRFALDLEEAARRRDAVTFLRLQRQQTEEIQQAQTGRDRDIEDTREKADLRREELRQRQQWEEEDARISLERKLEDQRIARDRELEEIRLAEELKLIEIQVWNDRQLADLNTSYQRKLEALQASLATELALIQEYEAQKTAVVLEEAERRAEAEQRAGSARRGLDRRSQGRINQQIGQGRTVLAGRASGGPVSPSGSYLVGEKGPEIFTPATAGNIIPSTMMLGTIPSSNVINNIDNSRSASLGGLVDPGNLDPILQAKIQNMLIGILGRM